MLLTIKGFKADITPELQQFLRENPPVKVKKPILYKKKNGEFVALPDIDDEGNVKSTDAIINTHPFVYFDAQGRHYFNVFRTAIVEHDGEKKEIIVTNPNIKTLPNCNLYAKGEKSHSVPISGSEFWADGRNDNYLHHEAVSRGLPEYKIVFKMTRDEVLAVELKPTGESLSAKVANATDAEKQFMIEQLLGKDFADKFKAMNEEKDEEE